MHVLPSSGCFDNPKAVRHRKIRLQLCERRERVAHDNTKTFFERSTGSLLTHSVGLTNMPRVVGIAICSLKVLIGFEVDIAIHRLCQRRLAAPRHPSNEYQPGTVIQRLAATALCTTFARKGNVAGRICMRKVRRKVIARGHSITPIHRQRSSDRDDRTVGVKVGRPG